MNFFWNLGQWFRRCRLKSFLFLALALILFNGEKSLLIRAIMVKGLWGTFLCNHFKFRPVNQEEMSFNP